MNEILTLAKEKGFTGGSIYDLYAWIIKTKSVYAPIYYSLFHKSWQINNYFVNLKNSKNIPWEYKDIKYSTYEEALMSVLNPLLNIIK